jgi:hypothetical protein
VVREATFTAVSEISIIDEWIFYGASLGLLFSFHQLKFFAVARSVVPYAQSFPSSSSQPKRSCANYFCAAILKEIIILVSGDGINDGTFQRHGRVERISIDERSLATDLWKNTTTRAISNSFSLFN